MRGVDNVSAKGNGEDSNNTLIAMHTMTDK